VRIWELPSGKLLHRLVGHAANVTAVAFNADGSLLASAGWDETLVFWNPLTGAEVKRIVEGSSAPHLIFTMAFAPNGRTVVTGGWDRTIRLWNVEGAKEIQSTTEPLTMVTCLAFSADGRLVASTTRDGKVRLWTVLG
jgi:WD40 repeat protein